MQIVSSNLTTHSQWAQNCFGSSTSRRIKGATRMLVARRTQYKSRYREGYGLLYYPEGKKSLVVELISRAAFFKKLRSRPKP
jgi:hypothetical protein